jgi:pantetheine-phosphate adenylyltransferase
VTKVLYPGSFDPIHNGHVELIDTASHLFDEVVVAVIRNPQKGAGLFDLEERQEMIRESLAHLSNVTILAQTTLTVDLAKSIGAGFIIKGLRAVSDFESELQQAQMNLAISGVHTLLLPSATTHSFIASKWIREISKFGGDVSSLVPAAVAKRLAERHAE